MNTRTRLWDTELQLLWDSDRDPGTAEEFARARGSRVHCTVDRGGSRVWSGRLEVAEDGQVERNLDIEYVQYLMIPPNPFFPSVYETSEELEERYQRARLRGDFGWPRCGAPSRSATTRRTC